MAEERISGVESVLADIANSMGKKLDDHSIQLDAIRRKLDEQEGTLYDHTALLREHGRDLREIKMRMATVETGVASIVIRQNSMDEKLDRILDLLTPKSEE